MAKRSILESIRRWPKPDKALADVRLHDREKLVADHLPIIGSLAFG
jgi:hypothetical protein